MSYKINQLLPYLGEEEKINLNKAIDDKWITEGPFAAEFISLLKKQTNSKHALLANNGTLALYLSLLAIDIKNGDEVIVPDFSFIASASSIVFAGGTPVFVDVDKENFNIDINKIEAAITKKTKAIMPVHIYGQSADLDPIKVLAEKYNLKIIEDAAQGFGVYYKNKHTGTIGDIGIISFFADKTITTGEGAVILTNNDKIFEKLQYLRNQGRKNSGTFTHAFLGMNFRMTDLQCAVGVAQIKKFPKIEQIKKEHYKQYKDELKDIAQIQFVKEETYSNLVPFRANIIVEKQEELIQHLENNQIQTRGFFYPLHKQPCFEYLNTKNEEIANTEFLSQNGISLPVFVDLTTKQISYVCNTIKEFYHV